MPDCENDNGLNEVLAQVFNPCTPEVKEEKFQVETSLAQNK